MSEPKKNKTLRNLARCRNAYARTSTIEEINLLLENVMSEIQDLLYFEDIDWKDFPDEELEP